MGVSSIQARDDMTGHYHIPCQYAGVGGGIGIKMDNLPLQKMTHLLVPHPWFLDVSGSPRSWKNHGMVIKFFGENFTATLKTGHHNWNYIVDNILKNLLNSPKLVFHAPLVSNGAKLACNKP